MTMHNPASWLRSAIVAGFVALACALFLWADVVAAHAVSVVPLRPGVVADKVLVSTRGKPNGSGVRVRYRTDGDLSIVGRPLTVTLQFDDVKDPTATVSVTAERGLVLGTAIKNVALPLGRSQLAVPAQAETTGILYVNIFTKQNDANSVISVPLAIGGSAAMKVRSMGEVKSGPDGEKVISMPVP